MKSYREKLSAIAIVTAVLLSGMTVFAQDQPNQPDENPPDRIAQLNYTSGSVSFQPGGTGDWVTAVETRPLTTGDNIWADQNSRAELHIGATAIRMGSETSMTFLDLGDQNVQLRLSAGSMILRVRNLEGTFEVDTPNLAFDVQRDGEYRLDVDPNGNETDVTIWQGSGEVTGGGTTYAVIADQQVRFTGLDQLDHEVVPLPASDDFDNWAFQRDQQEDHVEATQYVSPDVTGYQELDAYGDWHEAGDYGMVWTPTGVAADWAPYRFGHWVWIAPWGWTWVEDEPWGFAPFHYGRWAYYNSAWCWVPGPVAVRPVYAPALVAFVGGNGFSVSVGVGGGPVGWFPLGPGEVFVPYYRTNRVYVQNINVTNTRVNITRITNVYDNRVTNITYVNQRNVRAVTVVSRDTFINARPVNRNVVRVNEQEIARARVERNLSFKPGRESVIGTARPINVRPPARIIERPVMATRAPVVPKRPGFEEKRPEMNVREVRRGNPVPVGRPMNRPDQNTGRPGQPEIRNNGRPGAQGQNAPPPPMNNFPHPTEGERRGTPAPVQNPPQQNTQQPGMRINERPQPLGRNVPEGERNNTPQPPPNPRQEAPNPPNMQRENPPNMRQGNPMPPRNAQPEPSQQPDFRGRGQQRPEAQPQPRPESNGGRPEARPQGGQEGHTEARPQRNAPQHKEAPDKSHHEDRPGNH